MPPDLAYPLPGLPALAHRFRLRQDIAEAFFAASRNPEQGLPVAHNSKAFAFVGSLLSTRRWLLAAVIAFNVLAATAGLIVPRMLGDLVDEVAAGNTPLAAVDAIILGVAGVVAVGGVIVLPAGVSGAGADHARLLADELVHAPEAAAGQDGRLGAGCAGDLSGVVNSTGHDACSFVVVVVVSNSERNSPYPSASRSETGMNRSAAEFMQ